LSEENLCALCRHCTYEYKPYNEFVCHNEESSRYGEILNGKARNKECADFSAHKYSNEEMTLKDALLLSLLVQKTFAVFITTQSCQTRTIRRQILCIHLKQMRLWLNIQMPLTDCFQSICVLPRQTEILKSKNW